MGLLHTRLMGRVLYGGSFSSLYMDGWAIVERFEQLCARCLLIGYGLVS